jgi:hypothetical protein
VCSTGERSGNEKVNPERESRERDGESESTNQEADLEEEIGREIVAARGAEESAEKETLVGVQRREAHKEDLLNEVALNEVALLQRHREGGADKLMAKVRQGTFAECSLNVP